VTPFGQGADDDATEVLGCGSRRHQMAVRGGFFFRRFVFMWLLALRTRASSLAIRWRAIGVKPGNKKRNNFRDNNLLLSGQKLIIVRGFCHDANISQLSPLLR
jgi:hypothetical protein